MKLDTLDRKILGLTLFGLIGTFGGARLGYQSGYQDGKTSALPDGAWIGAPMDFGKNSKLTAVVRLHGTNRMVTPDLSTLVETGKWYRVTLEADWCRIEEEVK